MKGFAVLVITGLFIKPDLIDELLYQLSRVTQDSGSTGIQWR